MLKPLFILASACILLLSCNKEQVVEGDVKKPIISDIENIASQTIQFEVSPMDAKVDSANTTQQVNILIGEKSYQITTIQTWERIEKEAFEGLQIPASATDAIRETGNTLNKILYVYKQTDDRVVVREGLKSPNEDSISYKAILSLSSSDEETVEEVRWVSYRQHFFSAILIPEESIFIECPGDNRFMPLNTGVSPCG